MTKSLYFFLFLNLVFHNLYAITTNLRTEKHIQTFSIVTSKIRCICIPSIPIKSCSFNNCTASADLKNFIEKRIEKGELAEEIVQNIIFGYGRDILQDDYVQKMLKNGKNGVVSGIVNGFGEKMLAEPDPTWINLSLVAIFIFAFTVIIIYLKNIKRKNDSKQTVQFNEAQSNYLKELQERQK